MNDNRAMDSATGVVLRTERLLEALANCIPSVNTDGQGPFIIFADDFDLAIFDARAAAVRRRIAPEPRLCEMHPTALGDEPAAWSQSISLHVGQAEPLPVALEDGSVEHRYGTITVEGLMWTCTACNAWRHSPKVTHRLAFLEERLASPEPLTFCRHIAEERAAQVLVCAGEGCAGEELLCFGCLTRHSFAVHPHPLGGPGCAMCPGDQYVPRAQPVTRLTHKAMRTEDDTRPWRFDGFVWAANLQGPRRCREHIGSVHALGG